MHCMVIALSSFFDNLYKRPITNLNELRERTTKFIQLEELKHFHNQMRVKVPTEKKVKVQLASERREGG